MFSLVYDEEEEEQTRHKEEENNIRNEKGLIDYKNLRD